MNALAGLILSMCSNDEALTGCEHSQVPFARAPRTLVRREIRPSVHSTPVRWETLLHIQQIPLAVRGEPTELINFTVLLVRKELLCNEPLLCHSILGLFFI